METPPTFFWQNKMLLCEMAGEVNCGVVLGVGSLVFGLWTLTPPDEESLAIFHSTFFMRGFNFEVQPGIRFRFEFLSFSFSPWL